MADVDLTAFVAQKKREFATQNQSSARFEDDVRDSINRAINVMNREGNFATQITRISSLTGDVENLDEKYEDVLSDGTSVFLMKGGRRPPRGAGKALTEINSQFLDGIQSMATDIRNIAQDADTDDETVTSIGLGPLG